MLVKWYHMWKTLVRACDLLASNKTLESCYSSTGISGLTYVLFVDRNMWVVSISSNLFACISFLYRAFLVASPAHFVGFISLYRCVTDSKQADSRFASSQWETALLCDDVSHWLGASLESALELTFRYILFPSLLIKCLSHCRHWFPGTSFTNMVDLT